MNNASKCIFVWGVYLIGLAKPVVLLFESAEFFGALWAGLALRAMEQQDARRGRI
jgi:hypothetical protein